MDLFRWAPRTPLPLRPRRLFKWTNKLPIAPVVQNFGDLLSEDIVRYMVNEKGLESNKRETYGNKRLFAIGSIIHFLESGDIVWGSGVNGKHISDLSYKPDVEFHAVRGPLSRDLLEGVGYEVPAVYGDPGLLAPLVYKREDLLNDSLQSKSITLIPNLNDLPGWRNEIVELGKEYRLVSPLDSSVRVVEQIINSEVIITSSLHGFILAEAYGIPRALVASGAEPIFKYEDYVAGTGRSNFQIHSSIKKAASHISDEKLNIDVEPLVKSFPIHLWK